MAAGEFEPALDAIAITSALIASIDEPFLHEWFDATVIDAPF
jgi:hypothetical protein